MSRAGNIVLEAVPPVILLLLIGCASKIEGWIP
jgi:hypothetical protein